MNVQNIAATYGTEVVKKTAPKSTAPETAPSSPKINEQVEISAVSQTMQKVRQKLQMTSDVRIPVVEEIRTKIKNNDYPLDNVLDAALEKMKNNNIL
jgi:anti-sigma28 factor (negative regulator of flagellin synthesis)